MLAAHRSTSGRIASAAQSFVHGELYPSNVLVGAGGEVWPVDWEMAAVGPPELDLAALVSGWPDDRVAQLLAAYDRPVDLALLDACRLHFAVQWLSWSADWSPPLEHAKDWMSEARAMSARLGA